jgi:peptide deformylase
MTVFNVLVYPQETLLEPSEEVTEYDQLLKVFIDDMHETLRSTGGVGLAAPQVGKNIRVIVIHEYGQESEYINPRITQFSKETCLVEEACLSVPGYSEVIKRSESVTVEYEDKTGKTHITSADSMTARIFQHEIDHLDGILFISPKRMSRLKRSFFLKWYNKRKKLADKVARNMAKRIKEKREKEKNDLENSLGRVSASDDDVIASCTFSKTIEDFGISPNVK